MEHIVRFRPMTKYDYQDCLSGEVKDNGFANQHENLQKGFNAIDVFGQDGSFVDGFADAATDNQRGYIRLVKPVLNTFTAQTGGALMARILGINTTLSRKINDFTLVYKKSTDQFVEVDKIEDANDMLCYGEIYEKMINDFDIEQEIEKELLNIVGEFCHHKHMRGGRIIKGSGMYCLVGKYFYSQPDPFYDTKPTDIQDYIVNTFITTGNERIVYLYNLTKEKLRGFLSYYISMIPVGMRPEIDKRKDQLTAQYDNVFSANNKLRTLMDGTNMTQEVVNAYKSLATYTECLTTMDSKNKVMTQKHYRAIKTLMQGKHGHIREELLGKRCDFTGRSVIVDNPGLGLDEVGIPKTMIARMYRSHYFSRVSPQEAMNYLKLSPNEQADKVQEKGILKDVPIVIGRQPTLHSLSIQSYKVRPTNSQAIEVNPLVCEGYNADFDGDTMHGSVPITPAGVEDCRTVLLSTHNLFKPSDGSPAMVPRMEMLYGLHVATKEYPKGKHMGTYNASELWNVISMQDVAVWDEVTYIDADGRKLTGPAGKLLLLSQLPLYKDLSEIVLVNKKTIKDYVEKLLTGTLEDYKVGVENMCNIGFKLAQLYAPTVTILEDIDRSYIDDQFDEFHKSMEQETKMYEAGFESEDTYNQAYTTEFKKVDDKILENLEKTLPTTNGFRLLAESGARDNWPNILQIYSHKGMIARTDGQSFNAVIENCFATQLTPLEHFISAYGSRKGSIEKSIKPGDTGYLQRMMWHATEDIIITEDDCGTTKGMPVRRVDFIENFIGSSKTKEEVDAEIDSIIIKIIKGRYEAVTNRYIDAKLAKQLCRKEEIVIRSPLTCLNPCCSKCYGDDLGIRGRAVPGTAVGIIAAQSIGEPGTQLVMRTFHNGGVAGRGDASSVFDSLDGFVKLGDIRKSPSYTPIAWADGKVEIKYNPKSTNTKTLHIENASGEAVVPIYAIIKPEAKRGEAMRADVGFYSVGEISKYFGIQAAMEYIIRTCFLLYLNDGKVNIRHFEVLVASMLVHCIIDSDNPNLKVGQSYTTSERVKAGGQGNVVSKPILKSIKSLETYRANAMNNIMMEQVVAGISRAILFDSTDDLSAPLQAIALGVKPKIGTYFPNFAKEREAAERTHL